MRTKLDLKPTYLSSIATSCTFVLEEKGVFAILMGQTYRQSCIFVNLYISWITLSATPPTRFVEVTGKSSEEWSSAHEGPLFHYSSGMQAVMLAVGICDKVSIFGFGKSVSAKHHYHTNQKAELSLHDYEAEYAFYYDLISRPQRIPFLSDKFKVPPTVLYQ